MKILSCAAALAAALCFGTSQAGEYPQAPIKLVVGFVPGGSSDTIARIVGSGLSAELKVPVIVENKPGAGGVIATDFVAKTRPDGYTLLLATPGALTVAGALRKLPYDPARDFTPIAHLDSGAYVMVTGPRAAFSNVAEVVRAAKQRPGHLVYASTGVGATPHLAFAYLNMLTGTEMRHVPYKGNPPAVVDLMGGLVDLFLADPPAVMPQVEAGKLKALAVTTRTRFRLFPQIPTVVESGVPDYDVRLWHGLAGPAALPPAIVTTLYAALGKVMASKEVVSAIENAGLEVDLRAPAQLAKTIAQEQLRWADVVRVNNITE